MQEERGQKGSESPPTPASCPVSVSFLFRAWPLFFNKYARFLH